MNYHTKKVTDLVCFDTNLFISWNLQVNLVLETILEKLALKSQGNNFVEHNMKLVMGMRHIVVMAAGIVKARQPY